MNFLVVAAVALLSFANGANDNFKGVATLWRAGRTTYKRSNLVSRHIFTQAPYSSSDREILSERFPQPSPRGAAVEIMADEVFGWLRRMAVSRHPAATSIGSQHKMF